jgi:hypothetical protein
MKMSKAYLVGTGDMVYVIDSLKKIDANGSEYLVFAVANVANQIVSEQPDNNIRFEVVPPVAIEI